MTADGEPFCMADYARRATARHLRLHACGCMRLNPPPRLRYDFRPLIAVAERYADAAADDAELRAARAAWPNRRTPKKWRDYRDCDYAFLSDASLRALWGGAGAGHTFHPTDAYYHLVLPRHRVFEELIGPDPRPPFAREWRTDTAVALARAMYDAREFSAMPILADALQDAGCDSDVILNHCRDANEQHVRGCWVTDLVLGR